MCRSALMKTVPAGEKSFQIRSNKFKDPAVPSIDETQNCQSLHYNTGRGCKQTFSGAAPPRLASEVCGRCGGVAECRPSSRLLLDIISILRCCRPARLSNPLSRLAQQWRQPRPASSDGIYVTKRVLQKQRFPVNGERS